MQFYSKVALLLVAGALLVSRGQCLPSGPPANNPTFRNRVCNDMLPSHPDNPAAQNGNGGYTITTDLPRTSLSAYTYTSGQMYSLTLNGSQIFQGFLVIAHVPGQPMMLLGQFSTGDVNQQIIDCDIAMGVNINSSIGHSGRVNDTSTTFSWTAPSDSNGMVDFRFTVVQQTNTFYVAQSAAQTSNQAIAPPAPPMRDPEDYRLTFRQPTNCLLAECNVFVGIDTNVDNPAFLDITMQGVAAGWLAVGFSLTQNMFDADVVGCIRNPADDSVTAIDTWNAVVGRNNIRDNTQDVALFNSSFQNGIISCTFAKLIVGSDPAPQDRPLNTEYFILYGYRGTNNPADDIMRFPVHTTTPSISPQFNPTTGNNQPFNGVTVPVRDPEDYRLTFRTPEGCNVSNCTSFIGIDTNTGNNGVLDIYMEGQALGWVAVGFTETRNMFSSDVVACNRNPANDMIEALDTYNPAQGRANNVDARQNVLLFNSSFSDSRIFCTVGKLIAPSDPAPQDINLNSNLFVLWGTRLMDSMAGQLLTHGPNIPNASLAPVNPAGVVLEPPMRDPAGYRLIFRNPANCDPSACNVFVGIDTNTGDSGFLDIYMEGNAAGWVAVGFSNTRNMLAADVVGCNRDPNNNDMVEVVDTWNLDQGRGNVLDTTQDVVRFSSNFANSRISCTVAKRIAATDVGQDLNLNADLFVMYGVGPTGSGANALPSHILGAGNPLLSTQMVNPSVDEGNLADTFPRAQLLRAHGILMLIAWPLLAVSGIFFAAWMRPALPNGEWFKIHRAFLLSSLFVGAVGFMLAFIAHANNTPAGLINLGSDNPVGTAHYVIGIIVMFLHILNPIISACRCHPGDKYRWVFNLIHGTTIGLLVEILALTNIALGLERFGPSSFFINSNPLTIFWVYIAFLIFFLIVIGVLFLVFTILSVFSQDDDRSKTAPSLIKPLIGSGPDSGHKAVPTSEGVELAVPGQKPTIVQDDSDKPKVPSKDSPLRWGALTVFLAVNVTIMLVLIILIAI